jgi:menaquinol-cytochrome c reductase iron-sulfur subunit
MERSPEQAGNAKDDAAASPERRRFLVRLTLGLGGVMGLVVATPVLGFLFWPVTRAYRKQHPWRPVGRVEDFALGETIKVTYLEAQPVEWSGYAAYGAAYVRREGEGRFVAFSAYCTHTACPLKWVAGARLFLCPCHGGAFHADGTVAAGPPPHPLPRHEVRIREGQVEIRTRPIPVSA